MWSTRKYWPSQDRRSIRHIQSYAHMITRKEFWRRFKSYIGSISLYTEDETRTNVNKIFRYEEDKNRSYYQARSKNRKIVNLITKHVEYKQHPVSEQCIQKARQHHHFGFWNNSNGMVYVSFYFRTKPEQNRQNRQFQNQTLARQSKSSFWELNMGKTEKPPI